MIYLSDFNARFPAICQLANLGGVISDSVWVVLDLETIKCARERRTGTNIRSWPIRAEGADRPVSRHGAEMVTHCGWRAWNCLSTRQRAVARRTPSALTSCARVVNQNRLRAPRKRCLSDKQISPREFQQFQKMALVSSKSLQSFSSLLGSGRFILLRFDNAPG